MFIADRKKTTIPTIVAAARSSWRGGRRGRGGKKFHAAGPQNSVVRIGSRSVPRGWRFPSDAQHQNSSLMSSCDARANSPPSPRRPTAWPPAPATHPTSVYLFVATAIIVDISSTKQSWCTQVRLLLNIGVYRCC